jgi:hypothetical protein
MSLSRRVHLLRVVVMRMQYSDRFKWESTPVRVALIAGMRAHCGDEFEGESATKEVAIV